MRVENLEVAFFEKSVMAATYAMLKDKNEKVDYVKALEVCKKLAKNPSNSGHPNFLTGIRVAFDLTIPVTMLVQAERYHWFDIVTSQSTMHCLNKFDLNNSFTEYTDEKMIERVNELVEIYNNDKSAHNFQILADSGPKGIELKMLISTNYMQLRTMISQRKNHRLFAWREFCEYMLENLPYAKEFIEVENA